MSPMRPKASSNFVPMQQSDALHLLHLTTATVCVRQFYKKFYLLFVISTAECRFASRTSVRPIRICIACKFYVTIAHSTSTGLAHRYHSLTLTHSLTHTTANALTMRFHFIYCFRHLNCVYLDGNVISRNSWPTKSPARHKTRPYKYE